MRTRDIVFAVLFLFALVMVLLERRSPCGLDVDAGDCTEQRLRAQ